MLVSQALGEVTDGTQHPCRPSLASPPPVRARPDPGGRALGSLCAGTASRSGSVVVLLAHRRGRVPAGAASTRSHVAHTDAVRVQRLRHDGRRRASTVPVLQPSDQRPRARRHADRPDLGPGALLPRRRQPGPRRRGPAALRRPQQPAHRLRRRPLLCCVLADARRGGRPATSAASSTRCSPASWTCVWAFPVYLLAICLSVVLLDRRSAPRAVHDRRRAACCCRSLIIARDLRPVRRPPGARPGAVAAREGVRARPPSARARPTCACCGGRSCRTSSRR